jgi:DNA-binding transcriptional MocR family regulator
VTSPYRNPDGVTAPGAWLSTLIENGPARVVINETYRWYRRRRDASHPAALYVGSFNKLASGGARLGWIRGRAFQSEFLPRHYSWPPLPWQRAWAYFLQSGGIDPLNRAIDDVKAAREAFLETLIPSFEGDDTQGGSSVLLRFDSAAEKTLVTACTDHGVIVGPGRDFHAHTSSIRVCFTCVTCEEAVEAALRLMRVAATHGWTFSIAAESTP